MVGFDHEPRPVDAGEESLAPEDNSEHISLNVRVMCLTVTQWFWCECDRLAHLHQNSTQTSPIRIYSDYGVSAWLEVSKLHFAADKLLSRFECLVMWRVPSKEGIFLEQVAERHYLKWCSHDTPWNDCNPMFVWQATVWHWIIRRWDARTRYPGSTNITRLESRHIELCFTKGVTINSSDDLKRHTQTDSRELGTLRDTFISKPTRM